MTNDFTRMANEQSGAAGKAVFLEVFNEETQKPMELQEQFLMQLVRDNENTEFGKKYDFAGIHSIKDYIDHVPVMIYDNLAPYIERMKDGEKNVLTAYNFDHMNTTSGTVGNPKYVPLTDRQTQVFMKYNFMYINGLKEALLPPEWHNGKTFCTSEGTCVKQDNGITIGCASAKNAEVLKGGESQQAQMMRAMFTSPVEAMIPEPGTDTKYLHMRFALMEENVTGITVGFYNMLAHLLQYTLDNHEMLINDIEKGTIDPSVKMPDSVRDELLKRLTPLPERAAFLRKAFSGGAEEPFMKKVWPNITYIFGAGGDGLAIYDKKIKEKYSGGDIHNIYAGVTASEGLWSVPAGVDTEDSILAAGSTFMEFLPVEAGDDYSKCVLMDQLEVGKIYELIITNLNGFYRYRMSDAVKVTGYKNKTPLVQFMYRVNKTISVALEKTTEQALEQTVNRAADELGFYLSDYCVYPDGDQEPGRYVFLIEPDKKGIGVDTDTLRKCIYKHLCEANPRYLYAVEHGNLAEPEVKVLQPETGILYREMMIYKGSNPSQLKPVHVISNERQRKFFFGLTED